ncbi:MAG: transposase [Verrucomicrobia bacterium]|nr:transposase [Verrucomicrobiota bacterium]
MKEYPARLHHGVPEWVKDSAVFHVRGRCERGNAVALTDPGVAKSLLDSVAFYQAKLRWHVMLFVLMPDHWHALLSFPREEAMIRVVGDWKRYQEKQHGIRWQEGFFDHRIRNDTELVEKAYYIRMNPVRAGLCAGTGEWRWKFERMDGDFRAPST